MVTYIYCFWLLELRRQISHHNVLCWMPSCHQAYLYLTASALIYLNLLPAVEIINTRHLTDNDNELKYFNISVYLFETFVPYKW